MALEQAKKFLEELKTNDKAKELLKGKEKPANVEEAINLYLDVAKELGFDLKGEDLLGAIKEAAKGQGAGEQELSPDEMEKAGGGFTFGARLCAEITGGCACGRRFFVV